ncbi:MAG: TlpA family protein disulfide reductase [Flavobacterium sp.]
MKKLILTTIALAISVMGQAQSKNYVTFQAEIANRTSDTLFINENGKTIKKLKVDKNGTFKDTLTVKEEGLHWITDGVAGMHVYLQRGYDLKMKMDVKNYNETILFSGTGAAENNYLVIWALKELSLDDKKLMSMNEADRNKEIDSKKELELKRLKSDKLDPDFLALMTKSIEASCASMKNYYKEQPAKDKAFEQALRQLNNTTPPTFTFDNYKGGKSKLEDFKGKYVYIDLWATWCGYCLKELPHLKKVVEKYQGKNVVFVSISEDYPKDVMKWKKMIKDKEMGGEQLIADKDTQTHLDSFFKIRGIPRFIILDPNGKIVDADAPRPSDSELSVLLDSLLKL